MICEKHPPPASHATDPEALALVAVATGLADGIKTLVPECTVGVVAGIHSEWQLLAQRGPIDIATTWRPSLANRVRASDRARQTADYLVAPFSSVSLHVLLVLIAAPGQRLPARVRPAMQSLLDDGGVLLDRALAAQAHDRLIRRVVLLCQQRNGAPQRGIGTSRRRSPRSGRTRPRASTTPARSTRHHRRLAGSWVLRARAISRSSDGRRPTTGCFRRT